MKKLLCMLLALTVVLVAFAGIASAEEAARPVARSRLASTTRTNTSGRTAASTSRNRAPLSAGEAGRAAASERCSFSVILTGILSTTHALVCCCEIHYTTLWRTIQEETALRGDFIPFVRIF